jgi:hypothetical protein
MHSVTSSITFVTKSGRCSTIANMASGTVEFAELSAGVYHLDLVDGSWCLAQSDNVRGDGDLNVVAGETTNVWIFTCGS